MIQVIDLSDVCRICALKVNQFVVNRICLKCWDGMSNAN